MHSRLVPLMRTTAAIVAALGVLGSAAGAQVQATFYQSHPSTPDPLGPYMGGSVICSNTAVGTPNGGFSLNFGDINVRTALCGANEASISPGTTFGARFVGTLFVASTGMYNVTLNADDGDALALNGVVVRTDWFDKGSGPGLIQLSLNAGANPFVFDYYQGPCCGAFAELLPGAGVSIDPPAPPSTTAPEPGSLVLTATGIAAVAGGTWRRRRRAA